MIFTTQSGQSVGPIGQGTWYLGEDPSLFPEEYKALRTGVEAGMNLIDTAEMYGDGAAEELLHSGNGPQQALPCQQGVPVQCGAAAYLHQL